MTGRLCRGDGLAMPLVFLVGRVKMNLAEEFRKLGLQDFLCALENHITARPGSDPAEDQDVAELIEISVMSNGITQVSPDVW